MKKTFLVMLKLAVSSGLLALIFSKIPWDAISGIMRRMDILTFVAAILCYLAANYLSSVRWNLLVSRSISTNRLFSYYMIGAFFNTCLPGLVGGDAVKAYYLAQDLKHRDRREGLSDHQRQPHDTPLTVAVASVFMDRYIGLGALLTLGMIVYPFGQAYFGSAGSSWLLPGLFAGYGAVSLLLLLMPAGGTLRMLTSFTAYVARYRTSPVILLQSFGYSLVIQIIGFFSVYLLARGLNIPVDFLSIALFLPIIIVFTLLPVSISGLGVREGAFVYFFGMIGVEAEQALALSLLWFLSVVAAGFWGLVSYLRIRATLRAEEKENPF